MSLDTVAGVATLVAVVAFSLSILARRYPDVHWLQRFRTQRAYDPERDQHLDNAWMASADVKLPPRPPRSVVEAAREEFREFAASMPPVPPERKRRQRRWSTITAGVQMIVMGIALPLAFYIFKMMMFFSPISRTENIVVFGAALLCIVLGITAIVRSGKS